MESERPLKLRLYNVQIKGQLSREEIKLQVERYVGRVCTFGLMAKSSGLIRFSALLEPKEGALLKRNGLKVQEITERGDILFRKYGVSPAMIEELETRVE